MPVRHFFIIFFYALFKEQIDEYVRKKKIGSREIIIIMKKEEKKIPSHPGSQNLQKTSERIIKKECECGRGRALKRRVVKFFSLQSSGE